MWFFKPENTVVGLHIDVVGIHHNDVLGSSALLKITRIYPDGTTAPLDLHILRAGERLTISGKNQLNLPDHGKNSKS